MMYSQADKDQRALLYDCIRGHIVTLRGCKTGSKVIWLLYVPYHVFNLRCLLNVNGIYLRRCE